MQISLYCPILTRLANCYDIAGWGCAGQLPVKKILCIDDDRSILELRRHVLESSGYDVLTAPSGQDGLRLASRGEIDLVILDYMMPGMDGAEVAQNLKSEFPKLPVIAMSSVQVPDRMMEAVDAFIPKGQRVEVLLSAISSALAARPS
jgi:CheY-like chemotaxis protein